MNAPLVIAVPSKGRLQKNALAYFANAGLTVDSPGGGRNYRGRIKELPGVEIAFLSAAEIARELCEGRVHFGITGEDLVRETVRLAKSRIRFVKKLQFGHADIVVAVPEAWVDVRTMEDLNDVAAVFRSRHGRRLRVATKYWHLTQSFFAQHGIALYRIVESLGATEGAPAAGLADTIVDITSTGATLQANYLRVLDDGLVLKSQANLIYSLMAPCSAHQQQARDQLWRLLKLTGPEL